MTVIASYDIGQLGPEDGAPALHDWRFSKTIEYLVMRNVPIAFLLILLVVFFSFRDKIKL